MRPFSSIPKIRHIRPAFFPSVNVTSCPRRRICGRLPPFSVRSFSISAQTWKKTDDAELRFAVRRVGQERHAEVIGNELAALNCAQLALGSAVEAEHFALLHYVV